MPPFNLSFQGTAGKLFLPVPSAHLAPAASELNGYMQINLGEEERCDEDY